MIVTTVHILKDALATSKYLEIGEKIELIQLLFPNAVVVQDKLGQYVIQTGVLGLVDLNED